jgi:hypothetical protein
MLKAYVLSMQGLTRESVDSLFQDRPAWKP